MKHSPALGEILLWIPNGLQDSCRDYCVESVILQRYASTWFKMDIGVRVARKVSCDVRGAVYQESFVWPFSAPVVQDGAPKLWCMPGYSLIEAQPRTIRRLAEREILWCRLNGRRQHTPPGRTTSLGR